MIRPARLSLIILFFLACAGELTAQEPSAEVMPVTVGTTEIRLAAPGPPLERVDESDKKVQTALKAFWSENESVVLGVYAEASAWRQFAKGLGRNGTPAATLDYYALASTPSVLAGVSYGEDDFRVFKKAVVEVNRAAQVIEDQPRALTFRTIAGPSVGGNAGRIRTITSVVLVEGKVIYLTLFDNDKNKFKDRMPALALAWRDACLAANQP